MPDEAALICGRGVKKSPVAASEKLGAISREREALHKALCKDTFLLIGKAQTPTSADSSNKISLAVASHLAAVLQSKGPV